MSDGSTGLDLQSIDIALQQDQQASEYTGQKNYSSGICDTATLYIYAPLSDEATIHTVMKKVGIAYRLNDYRVGIWSEKHQLCFFRFKQLNSLQKLLLQSARKQNARVIALYDYLEACLGWIEVDLLRAEQLLDIDKSVPDIARPNRYLSTLTGKCVALLALLLLSPLGLLAALAIKMDSTGPVFFRQFRTGLYNREYLIVKFRSMHIDAERDGAQWAATDDKRITRVGYFLRKTRFDELPQLVNVIRGEMALIGPRPEREVFIQTLEKKVPFYRFRHLVKPGITGLAQVSYGYGASVDDAKQKHRYDLYYIKHRSVWLDLKILWKTLQIVLTGKGT